MLLFYKLQRIRSFLARLNFIWVLIYNNWKAPQFWLVAGLTAALIIGASSKHVSVNNAEAVNSVALDDPYVFSAVGQGLRQAWGITVNGEVKANVPDEASAQQVVGLLKEKFTPRGEGITVDSVELEEQVEGSPATVSPGQILSVDEAVALLLNGVPHIEVYTVREGDSLWSIAMDNDLQVEDLQAANPQLESEILSIGQELNLEKPQPFVHVKAKYRLVTKESVPFQTQVKNDNSIWRGVEKVLQNGTEGRKEVEYLVVETNGATASRETLAEKVLSKPVPRMLARGNRALLASRGGGVSGPLAWPVLGPITSGFGYRGSGYHTAVDIGSKVGTPVSAAEDGKVIRTGWNGNYGKQVTVDHGDGVVTRYSHLSSINVEIGDSVSRGDVVGLVGLTGRTTGPHLDFEVIINGSFKNPLNYLQ